MLMLNFYACAQVARNQNVTAWTSINLNSSPHKTGQYAQQKTTASKLAIHNCHFHFPWNDTRNSNLRVRPIGQWSIVERKSIMTTILPRMIRPITIAIMKNYSFRVRIRNHAAGRSGAQEVLLAILLLSTCWRDSGRGLFFPFCATICTNAEANWERIGEWQELYKNNMLIRNNFTYSLSAHKCHYLVPLVWVDGNRWTGQRSSRNALFQRLYEGVSVR